MRRIFFFLIVYSYCIAAWASNPYQVFVLHSYSQEYPWTKNQHDSFTKYFYSKTNRASIINSEHLDTKRRHFDSKYKESFFLYLKNKYDGYSPDLIYVTDDNALTFALEYFNELFKSAPVIFSGINNLSLQQQLDPLRFTGVYEKKDIVKNIEVLKKIDASFNEVLIVGDNSSTYRVIEDEFKLQLKQYPEISAKYIADKSLNKLVEQLKKYEGKYIFLTTLGNITDAIGNTQTLKDIISQISQAGDFIIISMEDNYLHEGVLGGYVTSGKLQGKTAAHLVIELQQKGLVEKIPSVVESTNEYIFNHNELIRNSLILPEKILRQSKILNKPQSFYQRNRTTILGMIIGLTILLIVSLITFLIILARKNRQIEASSYKEQELGLLINDATKELLEERQKLNQAQAITNIGNYSWDVKSNITTWSDELYRIVGYAPAEITPSYDTYVKCIHPDDKEHFLNLTKQALDLKDRYHSEYRILRPDGEVRYVYEQGNVKLDSNNEVLGLDGVIQDITQRKLNENEHERLQRELNQARKMEALGQLTGGIAHDFNNMLSIIVGFSNLALENHRNSLEPKILNYFENISQASHRARDLIQKMMVFSRNDKGKSEALDITRVVGDSIKLLKSVIPSSIEISYSHDDNLPRVMMDNVQMQQIIMNLCLNAKDAMDNSGKLTIQLRLRKNVNDECVACHKKIFGTWVEISVSDTGTGMTADTLEHIFEPFFTTKDVSKGTGMGLSVIQSIVDNHNGHILIDTKLNKGSTFYILFPAIDSALGKDNVASNYSHKDNVAGNNQKILVVDDEPILSEWLQEYLESYNYQCEVKNSSTEAWELFKKSPDIYDILITDQTMPEMTGIELIKKVKSLKPDMPVILATGYSEAITKTEAEEMNIIFMNKPVDGSNLLTVIAKELK